MIWQWGIIAAPRTGDLSKRSHCGRLETVCLGTQAGLNTFPVLVKLTTCAAPENEPLAPSLWAALVSRPPWPRKFWMMVMFLFLPVDLSIFFWRALI